MPLFVGTRRILRPVPSTASASAAAPTLLNTQSVQLEAGTDPSYNFTIPTVAAGDFLLVSFACSGVATLDPDVLVNETEEAFTTIINQTSSLVTDCCLYSGGLLITGANAASTSGATAYVKNNDIFTGDSWIAALQHYRGVTTFPINASTTTGSNGTALPNSLTTVSGNNLGLRVTMCNNDVSSSPGAGWTEDLESIFNAAQDLSLYIDSITIASAGTEAASGRTVTTSVGWIASTFALSPNAT